MSIKRIYSIDLDDTTLYILMSNHNSFNSEHKIIILDWNWWALCDEYEEEKEFRCWKFGIVRSGKIHFLFIVFEELTMHRTKVIFMQDWKSRYMA